MKKINSMAPIRKPKIIKKKVWVMIDNRFNKMCSVAPEDTSLFDRSAVAVFLRRPDIRKMGIGYFSKYKELIKAEITYIIL